MKTNGPETRRAAAEAPIAHYAIIPDHRAERLLLIKDGDRYALPVVRCEEHVVTNIEQLLGLDERRVAAVRIPRRVWGHYQLWEFENRDPSWRPPADARWVTRDELLKMPLREPHLTDLLRGCMKEWRDPPPQRLPWERQGWFASAMAWAGERVLESGGGEVVAVQGFKTVGWNYVACLRTSRGRFFFKAVAAWNNFEPRLTGLLSDRFPGETPNVCSIDESRGWMLSRDFGATLRDAGDRVLLLRGLRRCAELQVASVPMVGDLILAGCPDLRSENTPVGLRRTFEGLHSVLAAHWRGPEPDLRHAVCVRLRRASAVLSELMEYRLPFTLNHGDFGPANIGVSEDRKEPVLFDWGEASITHPFFGFHSFGLPDDRAMLEAYLEPWSDYEPMDRLASAFKPAQAHGRPTTKYLQMLPMVEDGSIIHRYIIGDLLRYAEGGARKPE